MMKEVIAPPWLSTDGLLAQFSTQREEAIRRYIEFVGHGIGQESIWDNLNRQVFLGNNNFVLRMQDKIKRPPQDVNIPKAQRRPPALPLKEIEITCGSRNDAIVAAYTTGEYSYQQLADYFNVHFTTVGNIVRKPRADQSKNRL